MPRRRWASLASACNPSTRLRNCRSSDSMVAAPRAADTGREPPSLSDRTITPGALDDAMSSGGATADGKGIQAAFHFADHQVLVSDKGSAIVLGHGYHPTVE